MDPSLPKTADIGVCTMERAEVKISFPLHARPRM